MGDLPREWERVAVHVRWPQPNLRRRHVPGGDVILEDPSGTPVMRSDTVADGLEKGRKR